MQAFDVLHQEEEQTVKSRILFSVKNLYLQLGMVRFCMHRRVEGTEDAKARRPLGNTITVVTLEILN